jgi:hypothetical protein
VLPNIRRNNYRQQRRYYEYRCEYTYRQRHHGAHTVDLLADGDRDREGQRHGDPVAAHHELRSEVRGAATYCAD